MKNNAEILAARVAAFDARPGARVGDFIRLPRVHPKLGEWTRITHDWGDKLQTGGMGGSYYLAPTGCSYSGGLDPGIARSQLLPTDETRPGRVWFFNQDISGAGRGISFDVPMRVFTIREGADLSGIGELRCPFTLCCLDAEQHAQTCNYWYAITRNGMSHCAFTTEGQLTAWLAKNGLTLTRELKAKGTADFHRLSYSHEHTD